jgi:hypothetical protein
MPIGTMTTMKKNKSTTIQILIETRDELKALGSKGETYDEIVKRLVKEHREGAK